VSPLTRARWFGSRNLRTGQCYKYYEPELTEGDTTGQSLLSRTPVFLNSDNLVGQRTTCRTHYIPTIYPRQLSRDHYSSPYALSRRPISLSSAHPSHRKTPPILRNMPYLRGSLFTSEEGTEVVSVNTHGSLSDTEALKPEKRSRGLDMDVLGATMDAGKLTVHGGCPALWPGRY
jgi:hypothetical protein